MHLTRTRKIPANQHLAEGPRCGLFVRWVERKITTAGALACYTGRVFQSNAHIPAVNAALRSARPSGSGAKWRIVRRLCNSDRSRASGQEGHRNEHEGRPWRPLDLATSRCGSDSASGSCSMCRRDTQPRAPQFASVPSGASLTGLRRDLIGLPHSLGALAVVGELARQMRSARCFPSTFAEGARFTRSS